MRVQLNFFLLFFTLTAFPQSGSETYMFSKDIETKIEKDTLAWKYQLGATLFSFSEQYKKALEVWDKNGVRKPVISKEDSLYFAGFKSYNALDYLNERSKKEKIIVINEAHHNAMHRVFTTSILKKLYKNGYRYLGLEALNDTLINNRKFATKDSGYYTAEPQYGNLIQEAVKIGFTLFNYEAGEGKNGAEREKEQAQNIADFIKHHPGSKYLIHCGYDHVIEGKPGNASWGKAMAGRLKELTEIDPFTIDQVSYSEKGNPAYNSPYISMVNKPYSCIMAKNNNILFNGPEGSNQTDCRIIHPATIYKNGRPNWLYLNGQRKPYFIPSEDIEKPFLAFAYRSGEYDQNGIPADIIEINNTKDSKPLVLEKGKYKILLKNQDYHIINQFVVEIK